MVNVTRTRLRTPDGRLLGTVGADHAIRDANDRIVGWFEGRMVRLRGEALVGRVDEDGRLTDSHGRVILRIDGNRLITSDGRLVAVLEPLTHDPEEV